MKEDINYIILNHTLIIKYNKKIKKEEVRNFFFILNKNH